MRSLSDASVTATVQVTRNRPISELFSDADDQLFSRISHNATHVLKPLLPTNTQHCYCETDVNTLY